MDLSLWTMRGFSRPNDPAAFCVMVMGANRIVTPFGEVKTATCLFRALRTGDSRLPRVGLCALSGLAFPQALLGRPRDLAGVLLRERE